MTSTWILCIASAVFAPQGDADKASQALAEARVLWQTGKYSEAREAYETLWKDASLRSRSVSVKITLGLADCLASQGETDRALKLLWGAAVFTPNQPDLWATIANLAFDRGEWRSAESAGKSALALDKNNLLARWTLARLALAQGKTEDGIKQCQWFVDDYNARQAELDRDADALLIVGQASEAYFRAKARGDDLFDQLMNVINHIYEQAIKTDKNCWRAAWLEGRMFIAGYNERLAMPELQRALKINPRAAEALVTLGVSDLQGYKLAAGRRKAELALAINPRYAPALVLLADLNISDERFDDALASAKKAVAINPKSEDALARLAAAYRLLVKPYHAQFVEADALSRNPKPADFYSALGERLADRRKYDSAERAFLNAIAADPDRADPRNGLGMLYMQVGREEEAFDLFKNAFSADPVNVRADNMLRVLRHMARYRTITSDHYRVLVDPSQDTLLGRYMSAYLEGIYPELTARFGYSPPERSVVEIMKNHQWFSGRTTALPFIPTVGACTGRVVALASPKTMGKAFNWSRVLKHEMVHVITLQQTRFNIPHWYTEALAVESEGYPRPQEWNKMLLERAPAKRLLNLDNINLGFIRPKEADERQLAYCQAQLYAQYMLKRFGSDALIKMLDAYRSGLTTDRAVTSCFKVTKADFESGYLKFVDDVVKTIRTRVSEEQPVSFSKLEAMLAAKPDDPELNARMAYEHFSRRDYKEARPYADKALKLEPNQPLASYVKARLLLSIGEDDSALKVLEPALDPKKPNERVVDLLAELVMKAGRLDEAERLYEIARKDDPYHSKWIAGLARVHLRQRRLDKFLADLAMLADNDADNLEVRQALAERHLKAGAADLSEKWATDCLYIDVYDPANHVLLADAKQALKKFAEAVKEYETALELKPKKPNEIKVKLARALADAGRPDEARSLIDAVLRDEPANAEAKKLKADLEGRKA